MEIIRNKIPLYHSPALHEIKSTPLNGTLPLGEGGSQSQHVNLDEQRSQHNVIANIPHANEAMNRDLHRVNVTMQAVKETFEHVEKAVKPVSGANSAIKAKMQAAKRELKQAEDLVNALSSKRSQSKTIDDGRGHIKPLEGLIENIHTGYQKTYGDIIKKATEYMQDINTAIGKISSRMDAGKEGKIKFYPEDYAKDINEIVEKYSNKSYSGSDPGAFFGQWDLISDADISAARPIIQIPNTDGSFEFWNKKLSGQGFIVKETKNHINIHPDYTAIKQIFSIISKANASWKGSDIMAQEFQSIQTAIDSQKNAINSGVSRLLETFRQDNSHFDTLVQLLIQLIKDLQQYNNGIASI